MLYIFKIGETGFVKFGWTEAASPWRRAANGFWGVVHPGACCGKLGWSSLELIGLWEGGRADEKLVQDAVPSEVGEFWPGDLLERLLTELGTDRALPLPPRPAKPPTEGLADPEVLPCCGAQGLACWQCDKTFKRWAHLKQHLQSHGGVKVECNCCGTRVVKRFLTRHQGSLKCKAHRA